MKKQRKQIKICHIVDLNQTKSNTTLNFNGLKNKWGQFFFLDSLFPKLILWHQSLLKITVVLKINNKFYYLFSCCCITSQ